MVGVAKASATADQPSFFLVAGFGLVGVADGHVGEEGDGDELEAGERGAGRAEDLVERRPFREWCHRVPAWQVWVWDVSLRCGLG